MSTRPPLQIALVGQVSATVNQQRTNILISESENGLLPYSLRGDALKLSTLERLRAAQKVLFEPLIAEPTFTFSAKDGILGLTRL